MKNRIHFFVGMMLLPGLLFFTAYAHAFIMEDDARLELLGKKGIVIEEEASFHWQEMPGGVPNVFDKETIVAQVGEETTGGSKGEERGHYHSVKGLAERLKELEAKAEKEGELGAWAERIQLSGLLEVAVFYETIDRSAPSVDDENSSDIVLATAELGVDADIAKHVKGHVLLLWEEDDTEPIDLDEGIISINGEDVVPLYLNAGKMYVPFGRFESHLISDPLTLELGETRESALVGGFGIDWIELSIGVFNGDIDKTGSDNQIESFVGGALFTLPEDKISGFGLLAAGVYYISNIADSNGLQDAGTGVSAATVSDYVGGFSVFVSASLMDKFFFEAEYLGATGKFEAGELSFDGGEEFNPRTWNLELAFAPIDRLEIAGRYGGSGDCDNFLPNMQYGAAAVYGLFENTSLALEYLFSEFENDDKSSLITSQLAVEF